MPKWLQIETGEAPRTKDAAERATSATNTSRKRVLPWLIGAVVLGTIVGLGAVFAMRGAFDADDAASNPADLRGALAVVNGEPILHRDVDVEFIVQGELRRRLMGQDLVGEAAEIAFRRELVDRLVDRWLVLQDAAAQGVTVTDAELAAELPGLGSQIGVQSDDLRQAILQSPFGLTEESWLRWARQQLVVGRYLTSDRAQQLQMQHIQTIGRCQEPVQCAAGMLYEEADVRFAIDGELIAPARVGAPAPDFELPTPEGEMVRLSQFRGKPVMINFWATWCAPCRIEMPLFVNAYETNKDDLVILAVDSQETPAEVTAFAQAFNMTMPIVIDDGTASSIYRVSALPTTFFINPEGIIVRAHRGVIPSRPELKPLIEEIFPGVQLGAADLDLRPRALLASLR